MIKRIYRVLVLHYYNYFKSLVINLDQKILKNKAKHSDVEIFAQNKIDFTLSIIITYILFFIEFFKRFTFCSNQPNLV